MNRRLLLIAAAALLSGCATAPAVVAPPDASFAELEPVFTASAARRTLTIRVASNGCTKKTDFTFYLEPRGQAAAIAFARTTPDRCRAFAPAYAELTYTFEELGVTPRTPLFLLNPIASWDGPGGGATS